VVAQNQDSLLRLRESHQFCTLFARVNARHFYYAFRFMSSEPRRAIHAVYAFCQKADQLVDLEPDITLKRARILERREDLKSLESMLAGSLDPFAQQDPILLALWDALRKRPVRLELFHFLLDGMEMDLEPRDWATLDDLKTYCWHVASVVGIMVVELLGAKDEHSIRFAEELGVAMQLTNISRDVREDLIEGRVYLPVDLMQRHGVSRADLERGEHSPAIRSMMKEICTIADGLYDEALAKLPKEHWKRLRTTRVMAALYRPILWELRARDYDVLAGKVGYPIYKKVLIALKTLLS
jgi:15-cis-phytoene synthase